MTCVLHSTLHFWDSFILMQEAINYSCSLLCNTPLCGYTILYSIIYGHLCCCQFFTSTDISVMNILMLMCMIKLFPKVGRYYPLSSSPTQFFLTLTSLPSFCSLRKEIYLLFSSAPPSWGPINPDLQYKRCSSLVYPFPVPLSPRVYGNCQDLYLSKPSNGFQPTF